LGNTDRYEKVEAMPHILHNALVTEYLRCKACGGEFDSNTDAKEHENLCDRFRE
jgi:hypothetical protein